MPTPGQQAAAALKAAKAEAQKAGRSLSWEEVARIIDSCLQDAHSGADGSPRNDFGDRRAIPPTPEQVTAYSASIGFNLDGQHFCDFYSSKGWLVGKAKMKDWQAAVRTWRRSGITAGRKPSTVGRDYGKL